MDIGKALKDSWELFAKDALALIVGALIVVLLGSLSLGIVIVPLVAGLYLMIMRRVREGRPAEIGDVFACFDRFGAYFVAFLVFLAIGVAYVVVVGAPIALAVVAGMHHETGLLVMGVLLTLLVLAGTSVVLVYIGTVWVYAIPLMIERRIGIIDAMRESRALVMSTSFWITLALYLIVSVIAGAISGVASTALGAVTFGIGSSLGYVVTVVIMPWQTAAFLAMYFQATGEGALLPSARPFATDWHGGGRVTPQMTYPGGQPGPWQGRPPEGMPPNVPPQYGPPPYGPPQYGPLPYGPSQYVPPPYGPPPWGPAQYGPPPWGQPPTAPPDVAPPAPGLTAPPTPPDAPEQED